MLALQQPSAPQPVSKVVVNHTSPVNASSQPVNNVNFGGVRQQNTSSTSNIGMSINDMLKNISSNKPKPDAGQPENTLESVYGKQAVAQLDARRVEELWVRYSRCIEQTDTHLYSLMKQIPIVEGDVVVVTSSNSMQSAKLLESTDLIDFLRKETGVSTLSLRVNVTENTETSSSSHQAAYTSKEKLEEMVEINPQIEQLIKVFSLDVDF